MERKRSFSPVVLFLIFLSQVSFGQIIYQHAYGTSTFSAVNPYTVTPNIIDPNLNTSQWSTSVAAGFTSFGGSTGQALSLSNSSGTPTYSLTFNVAPGYTCSITDYSFWRVRSAAGAQNWTLSVNGATTIGTGTVPTVGANTGTLAVSSPVNGLSGTVNVVLQLSGASGAGTFRLDDFTLYGTVNSTVSCTPPTLQANTFSVMATSTGSIDISWVPGNGGNALVLASAGSPVSANPSSGSSYIANSVYGSGQQVGSGNYVVYDGTGSSVSVTGLTPLATYYFSVYEYNTTSGFPCYLTPALTGSAVATSAAACPTLQASSFNVSATGNTSVTINWTPGDGSNVLVLAYPVSSSTAAPLSGTTYTAQSTVYGASGQVIGNSPNVSYIVYNGVSTNSLTITNLNPGSTYYFSIFEYGTSSGSPCYLAPPLTGSAMPLATPIATNCLQIKSILIDACQASATNYESYNEMVYFKNGSNPLPITQFSLAGAPKSGVYAMNKWPNNSNIWNGAVKNATTAANVAAVQASITKCGVVLEPPDVLGIGTIPPFANVILVGSQVMNPTSNSFANLQDTVYMIFQSVSTTTAGNFVNYSAATSPTNSPTNGNVGTRGLVLIDGANGCTSNTVTYEPQLLLNHADGDGASYDLNNTITYYNSGCQAPYIPLSVNAGPNQTICYNAQAVVTATPSGVYSSLVWSGGTGTFSSPGALTTTYTPGVGEIGAVQLTCLITRTCTAGSFSATATTTVSITSLPLATLSATNGYSLCPGTTSVMSYSVTNAANAGVITPSWNSPAGSGTTYTVSAPGGTTSVTYTLDLSNSCGSTINTFTVYPLALPTLTLSSTTPTACAGTTLSLSANGNTGNYSWNNPVSTNSTVVITANTTTTGVVTSTNTCGSVSKTYTLTVTPTATISVDNPNVSLCTGQSATVTATSNAGTYTWQPGGVATNTIVMNSAGDYTVSTSNVCNTASAMVNVVVNSTPTLTVSSTSSSLCLSGQTAVLSTSGSTGTYSWSTGAITSTISVSGPGVYTATVTTPSCGSTSTSYTVNAIPNPSVTLASSIYTACPGGTINIVANSTEGNYSWSGSANTTATLNLTVSSSTLGSVTTTNTCANAAAQYTVTMIPTTTITVDNANVNLCAGQNATVTATSNAGTYTWSPGGVTTSSLVVSSTNDYTVSSAGTCNTASATVNVTVGASPTLTISSTSNTLCASGQTATLSTSGSTGTYSWSTGATTSSITITTPGVYSATITTSGCGDAVDSYTVNAVQTPTLSVTPTATLLCNGLSTILVASSNLGNYVWSTTATNINTVSVNGAGVYTVGVSNACGNPTAAVTVTTDNTPVLNLTASSLTICPNETATLTVVGGNAPYIWSNSSSTSSVVASSGGTVTVSNTNVCGTGTASIVINVNPVDASFSANPTNGLKPLIVDFTNNSTGATSYTWSFGNGNSANTQTVSSQTYTNVGTYIAYLTVSNGVCTDIDSVVITVNEDEPWIIIPNVFTPNGDSVNDVFKVTGFFHIKDFNCVIFDRWGLQMFEWSDIKEGWDGKTGGKTVPDGTYFYIINAKDIYDKDVKKQGSFTLFK